jgi:hypothetical protein
MIKITKKDTILTTVKSKTSDLAKALAKTASNLVVANKIIATNAKKENDFFSSQYFKTSKNKTSQDTQNIGLKGEKCKFFNSLR